MLVYIDIETIPSQRNEAKARAAARVSPPGKISKPETLAKWEAEKRPLLEDAEWRKTSLDGAWGELCCVCWAVEDGPVMEATRPTLADDEGGLLRSLFDEVATEWEAARREPVHWVGHNLTQFDLRFLWQRSVVHGLRPSINLRHDAPPWSEWVSDTMQIWAGNRGSVKLTDLCDALRVDVGHEDTITGADVWDCYQRGEFQTILEHCRADVQRTRAVYRKMKFLTGDA